VSGYLGFRRTLKFSPFPSKKYQFLFSNIFSVYGANPLIDHAINVNIPGLNSIKDDSSDVIHHKEILCLFCSVRKSAANIDTQNIHDARIGISSLDGVIKMTKKKTRGVK